MSILVQTKNQTQPVTIKVTVNSAALWDYDYEDRKTHYSGKYNDGKTHNHAIGFPQELHMATDPWTFRFINITKEVTGYTAKVEWFQGDVLLNTWTKTGNVPAEDMITVGDDCVIL